VPEIVLLLVRFGFLVLLWLFVLSAVRVVRTDMAATAPQTATGRRRNAAPTPGRQRRSQARALVVTQGGLAGTKVTLGDDPVTIGRADTSTLVLTDDYASTNHARLVPGDGAWLVEDQGSTNGTYLDRERVTAPTPVPIGSQIRIGKTVMELRK
jgi:pSer/pThr/pTyr-binding forkhead associated (FHA) protein